MNIKIICSNIQKNNICLQILPNILELRDSKVQKPKDIFTAFWRNVVL